MQEAMHTVNLRNEAEGLPAIEMGIGLNTGEVVAGNIGSSTRAKYGVVGHAVNLTSRIEDQTGRGEILAAASTLQGTELELKLGRELDLQPKGVSERVRVSQIIQIIEPVPAERSDDEPQQNKEAEQ